MRRLRFLAPLVVALCGCATLLGGATQRLADDLTDAILSQDDPATVRDGAPAYLLLVDALIEGDPHDVDLLLSGAQLYTAYAGAFVEDADRARRLTDRARGYGLRALCRRSRALCATVEGPYEPFAAALAGTGRSDLPVLYGFGAAWAGWIQAHADDWNAVAEIPKVEALMRRVVELDDAWDEGGGHLYLGVLATLRPASLGGHPEEGRAQFERAIELSGGRNLMAKVLFARQYARLVFDRPLHDRLLKEVLAANPETPGLTLSNTLAQEQARALLDGADDYF
jgi:TRAP transporter T-component